MNKKQLPVINALDFPKGNRIEEKIYSRWQPEVKAADDTEETITIYQQIGEDYFSEGFTARRMSAALRSIGKKKDVVVSINSPGGDFFEGATIYNLLREHEGKVTVKIPGLAASAASVIAMAGDIIKISEIGFLMIHDCWGCVCGNSQDLTKTAETFNVFDAAMADVYASRTGFDREEIIKMMDSDTWLNSSAAIEKGFADELMDAKAVKEDDDGKKSQALARRSLEAAMAKAGYSRKDREKIFVDAFGVRDTTTGTTRDAGRKDESIRELIQIMRG